MNKRELFIDGFSLKLGQRIGKGGEGEVYIVEGKDGLAVKIYTLANIASREQKVTAMVSAKVADSSSLVAFPKSIVRTSKGSFIGFTMNVVRDHRPVHELYSVKSRKINYPEADYRFLVRAAANMTRAIAQVHETSCVIGDLNHSGILISNKATVALIDADSFQFQDNQRSYPCLVGVPEFTPPELQGKRLDGVIRSKSHDQFGMAVAVFHLLFMGRHPYAGRYSGGDVTIDQAIARNLFAYSQARQNGMKQPPATLPLNYLPQRISSAFENAFSPNVNLRPTASHWVDVLTELEENLTRCNTVSSHYYPSKSASCPWCQLENSSGMILFLSAQNSTRTFGSAPTLDTIEKIIAEITRTVIPDINLIVPKIVPLPTLEASDEAKAAKVKRWGPKLFWWLLIAASIMATFFLPQAFIIWIIIAGFSWNAAKESSPSSEKWLSQYKDADERYFNEVNAWKSNMGIPRLIQLRADLLKLGEELKRLPHQKNNDIQRLKNDRYNIQLDEYLDKFLLRDADINGIARGKKMTLVAYGVETAADIEPSKVMAIPGFGEATTAKLIGWRDYCKRGFIYNPVHGPSDLQALNKLERDSLAKSTALFNKLKLGYEDLSRSWASISNRLQQEVSRLTLLNIEKAKAEKDLEFLGISKPYINRTIQPSIKPNISINPSSPSTFNNTCPNCGSTMIRRTARRGRNSGNSFWGCSRYPRCKGTRP